MEENLHTKLMEKMVKIGEEKERIRLIKKIEKHSVFTYPKDSNERIITFSMSEKVWEKEFKEWQKRKKKKLMD